MNTKTFTNVTIKDADQGSVEALFSVFDVLDSDGDIVRKGAFTEGAPVVISAYGHKSWEGLLPVGKGTITETADGAVLKGQFFMDTAHGRDAFLTVKALSEDDLQEWSYSLENVTAHRETVDGKNVRVIEKVGSVKEVSPVLRGANSQTRTLAMKSRKQLHSSINSLLAEAGDARWPDAYVYPWDFDADEGFAVFVVRDWDAGRRMIRVDFTRTDTAVTLGDEETEVHHTSVFLPKSAKFGEHLDAALSAVKNLSAMAVERLTLRTAEGKSISEQVSAYDEAIAALEPLRKAIDEHNATPPTKSSDEAFRHEFARFVALSQGAHIS